MNTELLLNGCLNGANLMGAKFVKMDNNFIYFEFNSGAEIDDEEKLKNMKDIIQKLFGIGLKVRRL